MMVRREFFRVLIPFCVMLPIVTSQGCQDFRGTVLPVKIKSMSAPAFAAAGVNFQLAIESETVCNTEITAQDIDIRKQDSNVSVDRDRHAIWVKEFARYFSLVIPGPDPCALEPSTVTTNVSMIIDEAGDWTVFADNSGTETVNTDENAGNIKFNIKIQ